MTLSAPQICMRSAATALSMLTSISRRNAERHRGLQAGPGRHLVRGRRGVPARGGRAELRTARLGFCCTSRYCRAATTRFRATVGVVDDVAAATVGSDVPVSTVMSFYEREGLTVPAEVTSYSPATGVPRRVAV